MALETVLIKEFTPLGLWLEQLTKLSWQRPDIVTTALNHLLTENRELRWTMIVEAYMDDQISLGKAAELLEMHELELRDRFLELGIPLRLGAADIAEARAEVEAVRKWFASPKHDIMELHRLGADIWKGMDAQEYHVVFRIAKIGFACSITLFLKISGFGVRGSGSKSQISSTESRIPSPE